MNLLMIGNSFTDDTREHLYSILKKNTQEDICIGALTIGGFSIDDHYQVAINETQDYEYKYNESDEWQTIGNFSLKEVLLSKKWDYITLQQQSSSNGHVESFAHLKEYIHILKKYCPNGKILHLMTWAYEPYVSCHEFEAFGSDSIQMYQAICHVASSYLKPISSLHAIIPLGTAIQNARTSSFKDSLSRDGQHLSYKEGRYIAAYTLAYYLTSLHPSLNDPFSKMVDTCVKNAYLHPFSITPYLES